MSLVGVHDIVLVAASDGTLAADVRPLVRLNVQVIVEQNGRREQGYCRRRRALRLRASSLEDDRWRELAREAVRQALVNLEAVDAPAGTMTVVLGPGLARRAAARGDRPRPGRRLQPQGHLGVLGPHRRARRVAGCAPSSTTARCGARRGSLNIDDEGTPTAVHDADRERRAARLPAGQAQRAPDGRARRPATAAASPSRTCRCRA